MKITPNDLALKALATDDKVKVKSLAEIEQVEDDSQYGPNGGFTAVLSSPRLDRDGDVWPQDEWILPLPDRITVDADHGMSVATTIGSAKPYFDDSGRLLITASFSSIQRAQEVRTLIREGHVTSVSVAALTDKSKKDGTQKRELLNAGVVAIPANPDAVILDAKKAGGVTIDVTPVLNTAALDKVIAEIKAATPGGGSDHALLQAIHDASVHMGANCAECMQCAANEAATAIGDSTGADDGANKSLELPDESVDNKPEVKSSAFTLDEFRDVMEQVLSRSADVSATRDSVTESPAEVTDAPAEETAAASLEEEPAPVEEAAAEETEAAEEVDPTSRATHMLMGLYANSHTL